MLREEDLVPPSLIPVTVLATGQDGSVWLGREDAGADSTRWLVLDSSGKGVGTVQLPRGQTVVAASGDLLVAVEVDEYDVPYILMYRIGRR